MKKTAILLTSILMITFLIGCSKSRQLYNNVNLANYVEVGNYNGIEIDTTSEDYQRLYANCLYSDIYKYKITDDEIKDIVAFDTSAEIVVDLGDMVNIDYTGYNGEIAFEGGSATGALLTIGSGTFIDNFEDQLIGSKVGQTVEVNVTFPNDYGKVELAGVKAKFVVTVNSIAKNPEDIYKMFELESEQEYIDYLNDRVVQGLILDAVRKKSTIKDYPKKDAEKIYNAAVELYAAQSIDITTEGKDTIYKELVYPMMDVNMLMYYILDAENLEIYESTLKSQDIDNVVIAESYAVQDIVIEYLYDNAVIKQ